MLVRVKGTAKGVIAVKNSMREETRKRFTIAHELGHLLMPGHDDYGICSTEVIESWAKDLRDKEREANAFAAELLMPLSLVTQLVAAAEPSFAPIERLAATFHTSLTASGYRFAAVTPYSVALVWSQSGRVRWAKRSEEFKEWLRLREAVDRGHVLPTYSVESTWHKDFSRCRPMPGWSLPLLMRLCLKNRVCSPRIVRCSQSSGHGNLFPSAMKPTSC